jgi:hypothetical protein
MLKDKKIIVGKSYVNEDTGTVREVVEEMDGRHIKFNAFDLDTGKLLPAPNQVCHKNQLARWADREARPHEIAKVHPYNYGAWFEDLPVRDETRAQLERTKANVDQMAASRTFHRW